MTDSKMVSRAIVFAAFHHSGQMRKFGVDEPYIFHPLRVMMKMATDVERVVAVLHDVLEDTEATAEDVEKEFPLGHPDHDDIYNALLAITRYPGEVYADYIERVMKYPLAVRVKREDITDNMTSGGPEIPESLLRRWQKTLKRLDNK
jgi:hypothetical protein